MGLLGRVIGLQTGSIYRRLCNLPFLSSSAPKTVILSPRLTFPEMQIMIKTWLFASQIMNRIFTDAVSLDETRLPGVLRSIQRQLLVGDSRFLLLYSMCRCKSDGHSRNELTCKRDRETGDIVAWTVCRLLSYQWVSSHGFVQQVK